MRIIDFSKLDSYPDEVLNEHLEELSKRARNLEFLRGQFVGEAAQRHLDELFVRTLTDSREILEELVSRVERVLDGE